MSAYYDLFEKLDVRQTGEQQPLYARFIPKGTLNRKSFWIVYISLPVSAEACLKEQWSPSWMNCATALPMAGRWNWESLVFSLPL